MSDNIIQSDNPHIQALQYLFPFPFQVKQEKFLPDIVASPYTLLQAPTGFGKTLISLMAMFPYLIDTNHPLNQIVIFVRTKTQIFRFLEDNFLVQKQYLKHYHELTNLLELPTCDSKEKSLPFLTIPLIGKDDLCIHEDRDKVKSVNCVAMNCNKRLMKFPKTFETLKIRKWLYQKNPRNSQDLKQIVKDIPIIHQHCPYYVLRNLLEQAQIVVTTHGWLYNAGLRKFLDRYVFRDLSRTGIIIDEAHNIRATETASFAIDDIDFILNYKKYNLRTKGLLKKIRDQILHFKIGPIEPINKLLTQEQYEWFVRSINIDVRKLSKLTWAHYPLLAKVGALNRLLTASGDLWYLDASTKDEEEDKNDEQPAGQISKTIQWHVKRMIPFPHTIIESIQSAIRVLLMSATLQPLPAFKLLFGLNDRYNIMDIPSDTMNLQRLLFTNQRLVSKHQNRTIVLYTILAKLCFEFHKLNPYGHTLIFNTSKVFNAELFTVMEYLKSDYGERDIFIEGSSSYNQSLIEDLRKRSHNIILATMGGSFSEGVEIIHPVKKQSMITMIVLTGVPYPPPTLEHQLIEKLYNSWFGKDWAHVLLKWLPIYQMVQQACGRGIRKPGDFCNIICTDVRISKLKFWNPAIPTNNLELIFKLTKRFYHEQNFTTSNKVIQPMLPSLK